jgi:DNA-binding transcriptional LysR family regulator
MERLRRELPPVTSLIAFEAAARLRNFTRAADELGVSQAAVSRQIHNLEGNLGVSLFRRGSRPLALSAEGLRLYDAVSMSLRHIAAVASEMRRAPANGPVTIAASVAVTSMWLMPRVAGFRAAHPDHALRVIAADPYSDPGRGEVELAVRYGGGAWPGLEARCLFGDLVIPVAAPAWLQGCRVPRTADELADAMLLDLEDIDPTWMPWPTWFSRHGIAPRARHSDALTFNAYPNMIQAALDGQGVALGWAHLIQRHLERGELVRVTADVFEPPEAQYLTWRADRPLGEAAATFRDWLLTAAAEDRIGIGDLPPPAA